MLQGRKLMIKCYREGNLWYNVTGKETYDTLFQGMVLDTIWEGMYIMLEFDRDCTLFNPCVTGKGHTGNVIYGTDQQGSQGVCWWKVISCFKDRICNFWIHSDSELTLKNHACWSHESLSFSDWPAHRSLNCVLLSSFAKMNAALKFGGCAGVANCLCRITIRQYWFLNLPQLTCIVFKMSCSHIKSK